MKNLQYPVKLVFNIGTLHNDFTATDSYGMQVAYAKQKMFKLKEDISIYADDTKTDLKYSIRADKWIDFNTAYSMQSTEGRQIGKIARKGWASLWKSKYELIDENDQLQYQIREENAWVKVWDSLLGEIPILSMLTGYFFNPAYTVADLDGNIVARLKKEPSFWGRKFEITAQKDFDNDDDERIVLGLMMMVLLERRRG